MTTPVIFRKDIQDGDIVAFFPSLPGDHTPFTCLCYAHIGQHGVAHKDYYAQKTKPATPDEYKDLLDELISIGYTDLDICTRWTAYFDQLRLQELKDMYE